MTNRRVYFPLLLLQLVVCASLVIGTMGQEVGCTSKTGVPCDVPANVSSSVLEVAEEKTTAPFAEDDLHYPILEVDSHPPEEHTTAMGIDSGNGIKSNTTSHSSSSESNTNIDDNGQDSENAGTSDGGLGFRGYYCLALFGITTMALL